MTQAIHSKTSVSKVFLEMQITKTSEVASAWSSKSGFKNKDISPPTITHSRWGTCLRSWLCLNTSNFNTPPNPALTQPTSPLIRDTILIKVTSYVPWVPPPTYTAPAHFCCHALHGLQYHVPPTLLLRYKHRTYQTTLFVPQTVDILNHVPTFLHKDYCMYQTICTNLTNQL